MLKLPRGEAGGKAVVAALILVAFGYLLFWNLGHYGLWDDEANTALFATGVWNTGDTSAVLGHNIVGYRSGLELNGLKNRLIAPLPYFVAAPFVGLGGNTSFAARLPFALFGFASIGFVLFWLWRERAALRTWVLLGIGLVFNVSLVLYSRQGRYYPLAFFFTLVSLYCYARLQKRKDELAEDVPEHRNRYVLGLCASASLLLATHYLAYIGLAAAMGLDYLVFGWRRRALGWKEMAAIALSQIVTAAVVVSIWNPLQKPVTAYVPASWIKDKLTLFWWNFREMNACEFAVGLLIVAAPLVYLLERRKDPLLLRIPVALCAYSFAVASFSPQPVGWAAISDVRYMSGTIIASVFLAVRVIEAIPLSRDWPRYALALFAFGTNILHMGAAAFVGGPTLPIRSTTLALFEELRNPPPNPYRAAAEWLEANAQTGESVYVTPEFGAYPLMFHTPKAVYAWQFEPAARAEFPMLEDVHFKWMLPPDWLVAFGPDVNAMRSVIAELSRRGVQYESAATLPVFGHDKTRPELFWRSFERVPIRNPSQESVFIFRRR